MSDNALLTGSQEQVAEWLLDRIPGGDNVKGVLPNTWWDTLATLDHNGNLIGGVLYLNLKRGGVVCDLEMMAAGKPGWLDRKFLKAYFDYPFNRLGVTRITTIVAKRQKKVRRFQLRLGFTEEGNAREAMDDGDDAMIYGMLKRECRWIDQ